MSNGQTFHQAFCSIMVERTSGDTYSENRSLGLRRYPVGPPRDTEQAALEDALRVAQAQQDDPHLPPAGMRIGEPTYRARQMWPIVPHDWW